MDREPLSAVLTRAVGGDEIAFARIVATHHNDMARVCFVICGDADLAQEAVQAAWPKAWRGMTAIRDPERLRPWLISIAVNEARQLVRRRGRRTVREIPIDTDPSAPLPASARSDPGARAGELDLLNALAGLGEADRTLVGLRYAAGLNSSEIARIVGLSASGVRARLARLLDRLREELGDDALSC
ncbi:MAG: RNA polymerase sigma factor [Candidatus Limnocylindrales bacterium]